MARTSCGCGRCRVDFTEDHRIGKEILAGVADQYRKLRNTFRYLLGALEGFSEEERLDDVSAYPELERYMLHLTAELDEKLRQAVDDFDFNTYVRALTDFCNEDLSAFYFDIRKDVLYCEVNPETGVQTERRRAYRTVLDTLFHALVRWLSPVLVFTSEEVWGTRFPDAGSVHLLEWPEVPQVDADEAEMDEAARASNAGHRGDRAASARQGAGIEPRSRSVGPEQRGCRSCSPSCSSPRQSTRAMRSTWRRPSNHKCGRCWRHMPDVKRGRLRRCDDVAASDGA